MGLGIKIIRSAPSDKVVACGMFDSQVSVYNNLNQRAICTLQCPERIPENQGIVIFEEKLLRDSSVQSFKYENLSHQANVKIPKIALKDIH